MNSAHPFFGRAKVESAFDFSQVSFAQPVADEEFEDAFYESWVHNYFKRVRLIQIYSMYISMYVSMYSHQRFVKESPVSPQESNAERVEASPVNPIVSWSFCFFQDEQLYVYINIYICGGCTIYTCIYNTHRYLCKYIQSYTGIYIRYIIRRKFTSWDNWDV